ncbi:MAG TPA: hypothetical protein VNO55_00870 [Polyangia bacterium]|nr:hypothetical protein [Polyangia bacterium]
MAFAAALSITATAHAEAPLEAGKAAAAAPEGTPSGPTADRWDFYTSGRIGAFVSWAKGEGMPQATTLDVETGMPLHQVKVGSGGSGYAVSSAHYQLKKDGTPSMVRVSEIDTMRMRSGFTGNVIGFGVRRKLGESTVTGYISMTSVVDSQAQKKYFLNYPDIREGFVRIEGGWGSFLAGKAAVLFNRGAVVTDFLYLHGYGVGFPGDLVSGGYPTAGQIGYGVLANGFAAGFVYATPPIAGAQLSVGLYDPASVTGGSYERTKYPRGEFELTVDEPLGSLGKAHLYFNGGYQNNYQQDKTDALTRAFYGLGYGGRVELGRFHLAAGGHWGKGLGLTYPGLPGETAQDDDSNLKMTDGYFVMAQVVVSHFDLNAGVGRTTIHPTDVERTADPNNPTGDPKYSVLATQTGVSGAIVFHAADYLHFDIDVMHADAEWNLGEHQRIFYVNAGTTITW